MNRTAAHRTAANPDDVRWSLTALFSGLQGDDYRAARADLESRVDALEVFADVHGLGAGAAVPASDAVRATLAELLERQNALGERLGDVSVYLSGFVSVDAFDDVAQAEQSTLRGLGARLGALEARATAWIGRLDVDALLVDGAFEGRRVVGRPLAEHAVVGRLLADHAHYLRRTQEAARKQMTDAEEALAAALAPSGGDAWAKLHDDLAGKAAVPLRLPGAAEPESAGMARLFVLQSDPDRAVREAAYRAELALLDQHAVAFAAAMNGVKGAVGTLARRRGWGRPLDAALFQNGIDAPALEALQTAVRASFPVARRYLKAKARFLGLERLAWYDRMAPVQVGEPRTFTWPDAKDFVQARFDAFAPELGALARRAFAEDWIDVLPRAGKGHGAFCMGTAGAKQSRVLLNFGGGLDDVFTLAHELGHAFHNDCLYAAGRRPLQARTPMTLAETASIFCETLIADALLAESDDATRLAVLEQDLRGAAQLIVDIDSRFRLESGVFARRTERELSVAELDRLMLDAQDATYGDALDPEARHPRMWAQKSHYYSARRSFYNFPYTFGFLFGRGVFARYQVEPEGFAARYRDLLARTGMASVAELGRGFGIDVADVAFWEGALAVTAERVDAYEGLVAAARR